MTYRLSARCKRCLSLFEATIQWGQKWPEHCERCEEELRRER